MKNYRKPDQDYYDRFDRFTIEYLKKIEDEEKKEYPKTIMVKGKPHKMKESLFTKLHDNGVERSREREVTVKQWMREDEEHDKLVEKHKIPEGLRCDECGTRMYLNGHLFDTFDQKFLFVFDCPTEKHKSRKIVYPNGEVMIFPKPKCEKCGDILTSTSKKKKHVLIYTEICKSCGYKSSHEYDMTPKKPIAEEDRKKYCLEYVGRHTLLEDIKALAMVWEICNKQEKENSEKNDYEINKIEQISIPNVKERLTKIAQDSGFTEFQLEKPELGRSVLLGFSIQDPTSRSEKESIKALCKAFNENLFHTNWRLFNKGVYYRLGYLTGRLKAHDNHESLLKLAMEIKEKTSKKNQQNDKFERV